MSEKQTNEDFHLYLKKVMWYAEQEYDIPTVTIEEFQSGQFGNVLVSHCFTFFSSSLPFQNCACSLVEYTKRLVDSQSQT